MGRIAYVDYQALASEWEPGDLAAPLGQYSDAAGEVIAVWPAIGMVDVQFSNGVRRYPVEEVQRFLPDATVDPPSTPAGVAGADEDKTPLIKQGASPEQISRVSQRYVAQCTQTPIGVGSMKEAVYWASAGRQYRATRPEVESRSYRCGRKGCDGTLRPASYRMDGGHRVRLLACPKCLFMVMPENLAGCHMSPPTPDEEIIENVEGDI